MFKIYKLVLLIGVCLASIFCKRVHEDESLFSASNTNIKISLEHAFGVKDSFSPRGKVVVKTNRASASATLTEEFSLNELDSEKLATLVEENGLYFIRTSAQIKDGVAENSPYVSTFAKACYLVGSGMNERITISMDNENNILGLGLVSPSSVCVNSSNKRFKSFNSTMHLVQQVAGAVPDTQSFAKKNSEEKSDTGNAKVDENKSFIGKYWMYILPVFLILLLSAQAEPPAEGGE